MIDGVETLQNDDQVAWNVTIIREKPDVNKVALKI
jgi:hypothetical protein